MARINIDRQPQQLSKSITFGNNNVENRKIGLSFVDTPTLFQFNSEEYSTTTKFASIWLLPTYDGSQPFTPFKNVNDGDSYTIFGETFVARDNPQLGNEWQAGAASFNKEIIDSLVSAINQNVNLNWRYTANSLFVDSLGVYVVQLIAKYIGSAYNFVIGDTLTATFSNNSQPTDVNISSQDLNRGQRLQRYNYGCYVDVYEYENFLFAQYQSSSNISVRERLITSLEKKWSSDNIFTFDISDILKSKIEYYTPPAWTNGGNSFNTFTFEPEQVVAYQLRYGETFRGGYDLNTQLPTDDADNITNNTRRKFEVDRTDIFFATHGAFPLNINSKCSTNYYDYDYDNIFAVSTSDIDTLSKRPKSILRRRIEDRPYFVSSILWDDGKYSNGKSTSLQYRVKYRHTTVNGTLINSGTTPSTSCPKNGVYMISLSDEILNMDSIDSNTQILLTDCDIELYLPLFGGWVKYTNIGEFVWDLNNETNTERLYFRNSLGQIDQWDMIGIDEQSVKVERTSYNIGNKLQYGNFRSQGKSNTIGAVIRKTRKLQSGWVNQATYEYLKEVIASPDTYFVETATYCDPNTEITEDYLEKYVITNQSWEYDNENDLFNLEIEFEASIEDNSITK